MLQGELVLCSIERYVSAASLPPVATAGVRRNTAGSALADRSTTPRALSSEGVPALPGSLSARSIRSSQRLSRFSGSATAYGADSGITTGSDAAAADRENAALARSPLLCVRESARPETIGRSNRAARPTLRGDQCIARGAGPRDPSPSNVRCDRAVRKHFRR